MSKSSTHKPLTARVAAAEVVASVLRGQSLSALLPKYTNRVVEKDRSLFKEICFGSLRWYPQIALLIKQLIEKPKRKRPRNTRSHYMWSLPTDAHENF